MLLSHVVEGVVGAAVGVAGAAVALDLVVLVEVVCAGHPSQLNELDSSESAR